MSSQGRAGIEDLSLSLAGSGIHSAAASSSRSRPGSAKQLKRPNSMTDVSKERKSKVSASTKKTQGKHTANFTKKTQGNVQQLSHRSGYSDISSVSTSKRGVGTMKAKGPSDDFLAFFESTVPPKIKGSAGKSKKPSANAAKVLWGEPANATNKLTPKEENTKLLIADIEDGDNTEWITEDSRHSVFKQQSARSSSDEDEAFDFKERLSQSFSGHNRFFSREANDKNISQENPEVLSPRNVNNRSSSQSSIANNMTLQGRAPSVKVGLSSLENSYQNIKHKTPVNQTRKVSTSQTNTGLNRNKDSNSSNSLAEDYIKSLNMAATKVQRWFRRHNKRRKVGKAAIQRLLNQKKQTFEEQRIRESQNDFMAKEMEEQKQEERKRVREERAKYARQQAIQDLQKKREEKQQEYKQKAEEEIAFLQANGKITKKPFKTGLGKKKNGTKPDVKKNRSADTNINEDTNINVADDSSPERENKLTNDDSLDEYYQPDLGDADNSPRESKGADGGSTIVGSEAMTKTTLEDLFDTLKKLEEEEQLATARPNKKNSWLDDLDKSKDDEDTHSLNAENLQKFNHQKSELPTKASLLSDDKMKSIMAFLDEVQVTERLSTVDQEISKLSVDIGKPKIGPTAEELAELQQANEAASEVTNRVLSQQLELDEKGRTVTMLQKALNQQRELTVRHARETEKEMKKRLDVQKDEYEETIKRHLSFIDQLIDDKKILSEKCENFVKELKTVDKKYQDKLKAVTEKHSMEMQKLKDMHEAAEKLRREKWIEDKTKKIKEMTVKGLEPEIQRLIAKHKGELKKIKQIHEAELLESDERAAQKYVKMTEDLRDQLADEKEAACAREREMAKQRYEKQLRQEEEAYQQQRRRLMAEVQEEKDRLAQQASRQRAELDKLQKELQDKHSYALEAMKSEFDKAREEQERRHATELKEIKERTTIEKEAWEENYRKKQENFLMAKERELKENVKKGRNKEIELVIRQLEEDATAAREDCERVAENRIKRIREKYDSEMREIERSEKQAMDKYNEMKARLTEVEGENECMKVLMKQKDQEIKELQKLTDKMHKERDRVSDIIRQEFADRLVFTDEENKRIKNEMSELKARQRVELDKAKEEIEEIKRQKDEEMEEVHKRVKQAIVKKEEVVAQLKQQYQAALKRADHLEGLLQQQRKQLLGK